MQAITNPNDRLSTRGRRAAWAPICAVLACLAVGVAATAVQASPAADPGAAAVEALCAAAPTRAALAACAYDDFLAANGGYAEGYRSLSRRIPAGQRDRLRRMQTAWLAYRTRACQFESRPTPGRNGHDFVYWRCAARMTRQRSAELERLAACGVSDSTCTPARP